MASDFMLLILALVARDQIWAGSLVPVDGWTGGRMECFAALAGLEGGWIVCVCLGQSYVRTRILILNLNTLGGFAYAATAVSTAELQIDLKLMMI